MKKWIVLLALVPAVGHAETLPVFLNNVRMVMLDRGTPKAFADSVYLHHARNALQDVGARSLAVTVETTITLVDKQVTYTLNRRPIRMLTAYRSTGGAFASIPRVPHEDMWKKEIESDFCYSAGPGSKVFVTTPLSYETYLILHYVAQPRALPTDSSTAIDLPDDGLLTALHYQTAADILDATRVPSNVAAAARFAAKAQALIQTYLVVIRGEQPDQATLPP